DQLQPGLRPDGVAAGRAARPARPPVGRALPPAVGVVDVLPQRHRRPGLPPRRPRRRGRRRRRAPPVVHRLAGRTWPPRRPGRQLLRARPPAGRPGGRPPGPPRPRRPPAPLPQAHRRVTTPHVFITRGDLTKLACDAWLLPT